LEVITRGEIEGNATEQGEGDVTIGFGSTVFGDLECGPPGTAFIGGTIGGTDNCS